MTKRLRRIEDGQAEAGGACGGGPAARLRVALLALGLGLGPAALAQADRDSAAGIPPAAATPAAAASPGVATGGTVVGNPAAAADIESALVRLEERYAVLEKEGQERQARLQELEKSNLDLQAGNRQLKQKLAAARDAGKRFSAALARRVYRNVSRHVAGMAGSSIPYVGAGVSVGMTGLDVKEGCETLGALNELNRAMDLETVNEARVCAIQVAAPDAVMAEVIKNWRTAYAVAAAWANQDAIRLPAEPPTVPQAAANELWTAVFGAVPQAGYRAPYRSPAGPVRPTAPTPPMPPTPPSMK